MYNSEALIKGHPYEEAKIYSGMAVSIQIKIYLEHLPLPFAY